MKTNAAAHTEIKPMSAKLRRIHARLAAATRTETDPDLRMRCIAAWAVLMGDIGPAEAALAACRDNHFA